MVVKFGTGGEGGEEKQDAVAPTDGSGSSGLGSPSSRMRISDLQDWEKIVCCQTGAEETC